MNVRFRTLLCVCIGLFASVRAEAQHKYDLRSGIITFENNIAILGKASPQKQILYFDDYGRRERKELYEGGILREAYFCDGKELFNVIYEESTAYRAGFAVLGTEAPFEGDSLPPAKKNVTMKKLPPMKVAGKLCSAYEITENGSTTTLAGWDHITLYSAGNAEGIHSVSKAVKIEENVKIPGDLFRVPPKFKIK